MIGRPTFAQLDAVMCEADDLYMAMNEAAQLDNLQLADHYGRKMHEALAIYHALSARLNGATVN